MKVQIGIYKCTGIMGQDLIHPYIQSTTVLCDRYESLDDLTVFELEVKKFTAYSMSPSGTRFIGIKDSTPSGHIVPRAFASRARTFDLPA